MMRAKMRLSIYAIGQFRNTPHAALCDTYLKRIDNHKAAGIKQATLYELKERKNLSGAARKKAEADLLRAAIPTDAFLIALDESGQMLSSHGFADELKTQQQAGCAHMAFMLGGADGLDAGLLAQANIVLSLSAMTWPHGLARVMLCEQLWRAVSILTNHPYHRDS